MPEKSVCIASPLGFLDAGLELRFLPLRQDAPVYVAPEHLPQFQNDQVIETRLIRAIPEYKITID